jgi:hypothetical protein
MAFNTQDHPPAAPLAIHVGVTGHRTKGLAESGYDQETLRRSIRQVLRQIQKVAHQRGQRNLGTNDGEPLLRVVSPLAEGADRIVAEEALQLGYELESPLPFAREEYENDFIVPESRAAFRYLLERAAEVYELNGSRKHANQAYEAVGRWVLLHSDILIAIWNGKAAAGQGGTGQIVRESLARGIATVWVRPHNQICLLRSASPLLYDSVNRLSEAIGRVLTARSIS